MEEPRALGGAGAEEPVGLGAAVCYRHDDRRASARCRRCERAICAECMVQASVGWQCQECVRGFSRTTRPVRPGWTPIVHVAGLPFTPVVLAIVVVDVVVYLASLRPSLDLLSRFGMNPTLVRQGEWYRLVTSMFLHFSFLHIALNMFTLVMVGPALEAAIGRTRFAAVFLLSGFGGAVCSYLLAPENILSAGASGAIFGLFGAYFIEARANRSDTRQIAFIIVANLVFSFTFASQIDWRAHVGGLVVGAAVGGLFWLIADLRRRQQASLQAAMCVAVGGVLVALSFLPPGHVNLG